jgi:16S rRNA (cytidine1402-2'-O)-methyltransferase
MYSRPGAKITAIAHRMGIRVVPLAGPSSVILALDGFRTERAIVYFHGYLPVKRNERIQAIKRIERDSKSNGQSQIFMETPYRNISMLEDLVKVCDPATLLCIACDITLESEFILTREISGWAKKNRTSKSVRQFLFYRVILP